MDGRRRPTTTMSQARAMMSTRNSSMGEAPPLLAMNGQGYTVRTPCAQLMRALQVDRLQRRRDLATAETGDREAQ